MAKFPIHNETRYNGRDLGALVRGLVKLLETSRTRGHRGTYRVRSHPRPIKVVTYHPRVNYAEAYTTHDFGELTLKLCPPERLWTSAVDALAAQTSVREAPLEAVAQICEGIYFLVTGHTRSYRTGPLPSWAQGKRVRVNPPPEQPEKLVGIDYHEDKLAHEEAKLAEWEDKLARAQKKAKAWRKKVRSRKGVIRRLKRDQDLGDA